MIEKTERFLFRIMSCFTAWLGICFVPMHFFVTSRTSFILVKLSLILFLLTVFFSVFRKSQHRIENVLISFVIFIVNVWLSS
jgi:hypothetical protein